jgi:hypothetical protein
MTSETRRVGWATSLLYGFFAVALAQVAATLLVTGYAFCLAFQVRGAPNPLRISQFAIHTAPWTAAITGIVFTFVLGRLAVRRSRYQATAAGILVGIFAALLNLAIVLFFSGSLGFFTFGVAALLMLAGWLGGKSSSSASPADAADTE